MLCVFPVVQQYTLSAMKRYVTFFVVHINLLLLFKEKSLLFLTFSVLVANPGKTFLHGGQSRSWSAEQGKDNKEYNLIECHENKLD